MKKYVFGLLFSLLLVITISTNVQAKEDIKEYFDFTKIAVEKYFENYDLGEKNDLSKYFSKDMLKLINAKIEVSNFENKIYNRNFEKYNSKIEVYEHTILDNVENELKFDINVMNTFYRKGYNNNQKYDLFEQKYIFNIEIKKLEDNRFEITKFYQSDDFDVPNKASSSNIDEKFREKILEEPKSVDNILNNYIEGRKKFIKNRVIKLEKYKSEEYSKNDFNEYFTFAKEGAYKYFRNLDLSEKNDLTKYFSEDILKLVNARIEVVNYRNGLKSQKYDDNYDDYIVKFDLSNRDPYYVKDNFAYFVLLIKKGYYYKDRNFISGSGVALNVKVEKLSNGSFKIIGFYDYHLDKQFSPISDKTFLEKLKEGKGEVDKWLKEEISKYKKLYLEQYEKNQKEDKDKLNTEKNINNKEKMDSRKCGTVDYTKYIFVSIFIFIILALGIAIYVNKRNR